MEAWLRQWPEYYQIDTLDMRTQTWRTHDFSTYDVVYHVAGIAHADVGQVTEEEKEAVLLCEYRSGSRDKPKKAKKGRRAAVSLLCLP